MRTLILAIAVFAAPIVHAQTSDFQRDIDRASVRLARRLVLQLSPPTASQEGVSRTVDPPDPSCCVSGELIKQLTWVSARFVIDHLLGDVQSLYPIGSITSNPMVVTESFGREITFRDQALRLSRQLRDPAYRGPLDLVTRRRIARFVLVASGLWLTSQRQRAVSHAWSNLEHDVSVLLDIHAQLVPEQAASRRMMVVRWLGVITDRFEQAVLSAPVAGET